MRRTPRREANPLGGVHPQVQSMLKAEVSRDSTAHQLRQELHVLRDLLLAERKKLAALKQQSAVTKVGAPYIYSPFDWLSDRDDSSREELAKLTSSHGVKPKVPQQYFLSRNAAEQLLFNHLPYEERRRDYGFDPDAARY